jgi:hypothetical protein
MERFFLRTSIFFLRTTLFLALRIEGVESTHLDV